MKYNIEGADQQTGTERVLTVEASNQEDAEAKARAKGLLVSGVYPSTLEQSDAAERLEQLMGGAPPSQPTSHRLDYFTSEKRQIPSVSVPNYAGIVRGAGLLRFYATVHMVSAVLCFSVGLIVLVVRIVDVLQRPPSSPFIAISTLPGVAFFFGMVGTGVFLLNGAAMLQLLAELALAQRDIARNSFQR